MESRDICNICYQNDAPVQCKVCLYEVCTECLYRYGEPRCPACQTLYEKEVLPKVHVRYVLNNFKEHLKNDKLFLVRKRMVNFSNDNIELIKTCPKCLKYIVKKDGEGICISCGNNICLECEENHQGVCNEEAVKNIKFLNEKYMKCPMCLTYIEKVDGCNHMRCLSCGSQFNSENSKEIYYRKFNYMDVRDNNLVYSSRRLGTKLTDLDSSIQYYDYLNPYTTLHLGELISNYLLERKCKGLEIIHTLAKPFLDSKPNTNEILYKLLSTNQIIEDFKAGYDPQSGKEGLYNSEFYSSLFFVIDHILKMTKPKTYTIKNLMIHGSLSDCFDKYRQEYEGRHDIIQSNKFITSRKLSIITESNDSLENILVSCSLIKEINPNHLIVLASNSEKGLWIEKLLTNNINSKTNIIFYDDIENKNSDFFSLDEGEEFINIILDKHINDLIIKGRALVVFGRIPTSPNILLKSFLQQLVTLIKKNKTIFHIHSLVEYNANEIYPLFQPLLIPLQRRLKENTIFSNIKVLKIDLNPDEKIFYSQCLTNTGVVLDGERYITNMCKEILNIKGLVSSENLFIGKMRNFIPLSSNQNVVIGLKFDSSIKYIKTLCEEEGIKPLVITYKSDLATIRNSMNMFQNKNKQVLLININTIKKIPVLPIRNNIRINAFLFSDFDFQKTITFISLFNKPTSYINIIDPADSVNSVEKLQQYLWCDIEHLVLKKS